MTMQGTTMHGRAEYQLESEKVERYAVKKSELMELHEEWLRVYQSARR